MHIIATFVQLSDLHFGKPPQGRIAWLKWAIRKLPGLGVHDEAVTAAAHRFVKRLQRKQSAEVLMTGDLTASGSHEQFLFGRGFLQNTGSLKLKVDWLRSEGGLGISSWRRGTIPGNHDHWKGDSLWRSRRRKPHFIHTFPDLPFWQTKCALTNEVYIRFIGIDTDSDTGSGLPALIKPSSLYRGYNRVMARGMFISQLEALGAHLGKRPEGEIRVLLLHHSWSHTLQQCTRWRTTPRWYVDNVIDRKSCMALEELLQVLDIKVLLSGHVHVSHIERIPLPVGKQVLEARCGTSTQLTRASRDQDGHEPLRLQQNATGLSQNTILLHQLVSSDDDILWKTETYVYNGRGFVHADSFVGRGPYLHEEMVVWTKP